MVLAATTAGWPSVYPSPASRPAHSRTLIASRMKNVTSLIPAQPTMTKMMALGMGRKELSTMAGQVSLGPARCTRSMCLATRRLPGMATMNRSPHNRPAHQYKMSNFIRPGIAASRITASVPCPTLANAAAEMMDSVLPFSSSATTGCVPTSDTRNGSSAQKNTPLSTMPAQQRMSAARGFPSQGSRGSFHRSAVAGAPAASAAGPSAGCADSVSGTLMRQPPNVGAPLSGGYQHHERNHPASEHTVAVAPAWHDEPAGLPFGRWWQARPVSSRPGPARSRVVSVAVGQQDGPDAGDGLRMRLGEQGGGRLLAVLAGAPHPGGDEPGHDRGREGRTAPLGHAVEIP